MSYEKQTWVPYDDNLSEEENINAGAIVTAERMNYLEGGLQQHTEDADNPHQVTKNQVGLGNVDNVQQASKVNFDNHLSNKDNPHSVTAGQVGAYTKAEVDEKYLTKTDASEQLGTYYSKVEADNKFLSKTEATSTYLSKPDAENLYIPRDKPYLTYPIGAPYLSFLPDNPATVLGGGTWEREAIGRTLVGVDENDPDFATAGLTGGQKTQGLRALIGAVNSSPGVIGYKTADSLPGYTGANAYTYAITSKDGGASTGTVASVNNTTPVLRAADAKDATTMQPFITLYIWRRTA